MSSETFVELVRDGRVFAAARRAIPAEAGAERAAAFVAARRAKGAAALLREIESEQDWSTVHDAGGLHVRFRKSSALGADGSSRSVYGVKLTADFDAPMFALLASAREFDLIAQWNRYVCRSDILTVPDRMSLTVFQEIWAPYPFAHRSMAFEAYGVDLLDEPEAVMAVVCDAAAAVPGTVDEGEHALSAAKRAEFDSAVAERSTAGAVRSWWRGCGITMRPLPGAEGDASGATRTRSTMMMVIDPQMSWVPSWLISLLLTVGSPWVFRQINGILRRIGERCGAAWGSPRNGGGDAAPRGTEERAAAAAAAEDEAMPNEGWEAVAALYAERIAANRALYGYVERRCDAFARARKGDGSVLLTSP
jgi:hypothetical protein